MKAPANGWRLLEVDCGAPADFLKSHIPGAAYLDTHCLEEGPFWNKVADSALLQLLLGMGIRHDTTVVLYGRDTTAAARAAHLMLYAGVKDVRLLDGGFAAWLRASLPCAEGEPQRYPPVASFGANFPGCPHYLINIHQAKSLLAQPDGALASIRTWEEFTGKTSGYSYIKAKGDIRHQFIHAIDLVPTTLDVLKLKMPTSINGAAWSVGAVNWTAAGAAR